MHVRINLNPIEGDFLEEAAKYATSPSSPTSAEGKRVIVIKKFPKNRDKILLKSGKIKRT
jgi:hypothetical protein